MTYPIEIKSIGFLIDEFITTSFKVTAGSKEAKGRLVDLTRAIDARLPKIGWHYDDDALKLLDVSRQCWIAQDEVMRAISDRDVVNAARLAQKTNAQRNALIRKLDEKFGDKERSPLEKTYA